MDWKLELGREVGLWYVTASRCDGLLFVIGVGLPSALMFYCRCAVQVLV